jgi:NAD-dependent deacetylase
VDDTTGRSAPRTPEPVDARTRLLVLTGAGISAESGLATFRGGGGLWDGQRVEDVATPDAFRRDPARVWRFYSERRAAAAAADPNAAHRALVELEDLLGDRFLLVTQNVDGLHARAGSRRLIEIHGSLWRTKCAACRLPPFADEDFPIEPPLPVCPRCAAGGRTALLRPDIVWFGEPLDQELQGRVIGFITAAHASRERFVFLAVGTSGQVYPAAAYVDAAKAAGAETWLANLEEPANAASFDMRFIGPATATLSRIASDARP